MTSIQHVFVSVTVANISDSFGVSGIWPECLTTKTKRPNLKMVFD
jgi:hypothetical protein